MPTRSSALIILILLYIPLWANADHGGCPREINLYDERGVRSQILSVSEPAQRAIIIWNGQQQILFLSTDLSHTSSGVMSEVIPFPSEPTAKIGSIDVFGDLTTIGTRYGVSLYDIVPRAPLGILSGIEIGTTNGMKERFFGESAVSVFSKIDLAYGRNLVSKLQARDFSWVAYDNVVLQDYVQSYPPVEYRFNSNRVFYPMGISVNNLGNTRIDLVIISHEKLTQFSEVDYQVIQKSAFRIESSDLASLSQEWAAFMKFQSASVQHMRITGDIRKLSKDFFAK